MGRRRGLCCRRGSVRFDVQIAEGRSGPCASLRRRSHCNADRWLRGREPRGRRIARRCARVLLGDGGSNGVRLCVFRESRALVETASETVGATPVSLWRSEMMGARAARRAGVALVLTTSVTFNARADESRNNKAAAQVLFEGGRDLVERNRFAEACPQFAESQRLDPGLGTLLWLADCYENTGQTASAWTAFSQAAADAATRRDPRETVARERAAKLATSLSRLTIIVSPEAAAATDLQIRCDGVVVSRENWGRPVPLDPGSHTITANTVNSRLWWTTVQLALGSNATSVTVPPLAEGPSESIAAASRGGEGALRPESPAAPVRDGHGQRLVGLAVAAGGATSILVGSFFSLKAKATYDASNAGPCLSDNECTAAGFEDRHSATSMATVATIAMGAGAAMIAGATVLYLTAPRNVPVSVAIATHASGGAVGVKWRW